MDRLLKVNLNTLFRPLMIEPPLPADRLLEHAIEKNALAQGTPNPFFVDQRYALGIDEII
jgi:hypothetical protein